MANDLISAVTQVTVFLRQSLPPLEGTDADEDFTEYHRDNYAFLYTDYRMDTKYETTGHNIQLPIARRGAARSRIIRTAAPTSRKIVTWTAERAGAEPKVPDPTPGSDNEVLNDWDVTPAAAEIGPDGVSFVYRRSGYYVYLLQDAVLPGDALSTGKLPNLRATPSESILPASAYDAGILNPPAFNQGGELRRVAPLPNQ